MEKNIYKSMLTIGIITFLATTILLSYTFLVLLKDNVINKLEVLSYSYEDSNKENIRLKDNINIDISDEKKIPDNSNYYYIRQLNNGKTITVTQPKGESKYLIYTGLILTIPLLIFIVICFGAISYYSTKNIMRPIKKAIKKMDTSDDKKLNSEEVYVELRPFVEKINRNMDIAESNIIKLKKDEEFRREFTANISHELKTPLTSINGYAELLSSGMVKEEDIPKIANTIHTQGLKLLEIIDSIIKLSNIDDPNKVIDMEEINLYKMTLDIVGSLKYRMEKKNISYEINGKDVYIKGNKRMIEDLLYNLVDNAIKYNKENGKIIIDFTEEKYRKIISIKDTGIGLEKQDVDRIFERFYMVNKSRSGGEKGTGLGLSIVKHIVEIHQGKIQIDSEINRGTNIIIKF